jgi:hypothetical protein
VIAKLVIKYARTCLPFATVVTAAFESSSELKIQNKLVILGMRCSQGERVRELWTQGSVKLMSFGKFW